VLQIGATADLPPLLLRVGQKFVGYARILADARK